MPARHQQTDHPHPGSVQVQSCNSTFVVFLEARKSGFDSFSKCPTRSQKACIFTTCPRSEVESLASGSGCYLAQMDTELSTSAMQAATSRTYRMGCIAHARMCCKSTEAEWRREFGIDASAFHRSVWALFLKSCVGCWPQHQFVSKNR